MKSNQIINLSKKYSLVLWRIGGLVGVPPLINPNVGQQTTPTQSEMKIILNFEFVGKVHL
ncbi:hypothetical protein T4D_8758 [Trichinella pseudospiralis]|uniref:Uncharacterized protein n=1 Tax=Trichinella pseudospiralis TaxID=6337 RepID=A0A0V1FHN2_TRIPS|nr:hypothetical protein T4D_8758 [Trichinella pseudospiralis]